MGFSRQEYCHSLLQGIFLTQGSNPCFLNCRQILYRLSHQAFSYITTIQWSNQEIDTILSSKLQRNSNYNNDWAVVVIWGEWQCLFGMKDWSPTLEDWLAWELYLSTSSLMKQQRKKKVAADHEASARKPNTPHTIRCLILKCLMKNWLILISRVFNLGVSETHSLGFSFSKNVLSLVNVIYPCWILTFSHNTLCIISGKDNASTWWHDKTIF